MGNPGKKYEKTRHNAGFLLLQELCARLGAGGFQATDRFKGEFVEVDFKGEQVVLFRPLTFMNRSGEAVKPLVDFFRLDLSRVLVCYDDMDIPLGRIRFAGGGGAGGHNGIGSIIELLGDKRFCRLRLGIGRPPKYMAPKDYVLSPFSNEEWIVFRDVLSLASDGVLCFVEKGIMQAMNSFNGKVIGA